MTHEEEQLQRRFRNLMLKGTRALQAGDHADAQRLLERAVQLQPNHIDAQLNLSGAYILNKQFKQATAVLESLTQQEPENAMIWTNLGAAYLGNPILATDEHQQRAISAFAQALALNPTAPNVAYNLGLIYRDRRDYQTALDWFNRAVENSPQDQDARHYVAQMQKNLATADAPNATDSTT